MPPSASLVSILSARLPHRPRTRFAPSPTGYLHLGHVVNAMYVWGLARALDGEVLFRLEDHDRGRCRPEYEAALLEDLAWLGFLPDIGTVADLARRPSDFRQSDCDRRYGAAVERLRTDHRVYACDCSRKMIAAAGGDSVHVETRYAGRCRERALALEPGRGLRIVLDERIESFDDPLSGRYTQVPSAQCGDLLLRDRLGQWTYQFAVTADDLDHDIDLVIRGEDLLESTGRQIQLGRMLGRVQPPIYVHHPLLRHSSGVKLSKSNGDKGIRELRAAGFPPEWVLGRAAALVGLLEESAELRVEELGGVFQRATAR